MERILDRACRPLSRARFCLAAIVLTFAHAACAATEIQIISGANSVTAAASATGGRRIPGRETVPRRRDGTLYAIGYGITDTTPGAYLSTPPVGQNFLKHFDPVSGRVLYSTYLDFFPARVFIDMDGAAYLTGISHDPQFSISPGAFDRHIQGGEELVVAKLNPMGSGMEFVTLLGGSGYGYGGAAIADVAVGSDGSVYVTGATCSKDFPTTSDAFMTSSLNRYGCDAFFSELNADASRLVYSTYLSASQSSGGSRLAIGPGGKVHLAGGTGAADFPTTAGTLTIPIPGNPYVLDRIFIAVWDPASKQFEALAAFGSSFNALDFAWNGNRVAVYAYNNLYLSDSIQSTPGAIWPITGPLILVVDVSSWQIVYATGLPENAEVGGIAMDDAGSVTIAGSQTDAIPPSPGAYLLSSFYGAFVAKFDPSGRHILFATYFEGPSLFHAAITPETIYIASSGGTTIAASPPFPVIASPPLAGKCATMYAIPSVVQQCGSDIPKQMLYWDACDPQLATAEIHSGAPHGPLLASSTSGTLQLTPSNTNYYLVDPSGLVLATEQVAYQAAQRCSEVPAPTSELTAVPNPVLSCAENPSTGTQTSLQAYPGYPSEIHVNAPDGPELVYSPNGGVSAVTGDWVRDGTDFFLTLHSSQQVLAMQRVFLLPIRSCLAGAPAPGPALQSKPPAIGACGSNATATLAWYSAGVHPVEIRESSPMGPTVARFDADSGLLDVSPKANVTYSLVGYVDGTWKDLAVGTTYVTTSGCK